jgi:hypothetical protein
VGGPGAVQCHTAKCGRLYAGALLLVNRMNYNQRNLRSSEPASRTCVDFHALRPT